MKRKDRDHLNLLCDIGDLATLLTGSENIESFLQRTVAMVSRHLDADVCSIYLYDDKSRELVLTATVGLNPEAVGKVRMKAGEGLVGLSLEQAHPISEGSASRNPQFKYFEEADEDRFESFLAVPIQRGVEKIGVLVVQHENRNYFDDLDMMALRATASQLAGAIENARLLMDLHGQSAQPLGTELFDALRFIKAESASGGYALAGSAIYARSHGRLLAIETDTDPPGTLEDFHMAVQKTIDQLKNLQDRFSERLPESAALIFTAHFMILKDPRFIHEIVQRIEQGASAAEAVKAVARQYISIFAASSHAYMREKANDIEDLAGRLLKNLQLRDTEEAPVCKGRILVARELYPSEVLKLASEDVKGVILVSGGVTSHVSILARSMRIPLVIADRPELMKLPEGTPVILDADIGNIYINPTPRIIEKFETRNKIQQASTPVRKTLSPKTATTDGVRIRLLANINLLSELPLARELNSEGVGLYRTEFPFIIRPNFPSEEEQYLVYKKLFDEMAGREVTIRTLDVGGEKVLAYSDAAGEANPELGLRSIRFSLCHRDIFEQQLRAILRAAAEAAGVRIMFPMISSLDEFTAARQTVLDCINALAKAGLPHHDHPAIGMMVELPSVLEIMDEFTQAADFFSIGTNDFIQYMLAADRTNEKVAAYYQPSHPSVLRALARIVQTVRREGKDISICGEMAHEAEYIPFFLGIGIRRLSVDPQLLPAVQTRILRLRMADAEEYAQRLLGETTIKGVQKILNNPEFA